MNDAYIRALVKTARQNAREARQAKRVFGRDYYAGCLHGEVRAYLMAARMLKGWETQARGNNPLRRFAA